MPSPHLCCICVCFCACHSKRVPDSVLWSYIRVPCSGAPITLLSLRLSCPHQPKGTAACGPLHRHPLPGSPPSVSSHHQRLSGTISCHCGDRIHRLHQCHSHSRHGPPLPRDHLGNIVWIGPLMPDTALDVIIWDEYGPSRNLGLFKAFQVGNHDGAYKGRMHSHTPFIGRKVLTEREREYNNVHGYYRAHLEHLFARLWQWKVI